MMTPTPPVLMLQPYDVSPFGFPLKKKDSTHPSLNPSPLVFGHEEDDLPTEEGNPNDDMPRNQYDFFSAMFRLIGLTTLIEKFGNTSETDKAIHDIENEVDIPTTGELNQMLDDLDD